MSRITAILAVLGAAVALSSAASTGCSKFGASSTDDVPDADVPDTGTVDSDAAPAVERRLFIFGGEKIDLINGPKSAVNASYVAVLAADGSIGSWVRAPALDVDRANGTATVLDGVALFFGGVVGGVPATASAQKALLGTTAEGSVAPWTPLALFKVGRSHPSAAGANGAVYLSGGTTAANVRSDEVDRYDVATNMWSTPAKLNEPLAGHATLIRNGRLYVIGGEKVGTAGASKESTAAAIQGDGTLAGWGSVGVLAVAVAYHGLVEIDPWLFTIGGATALAGATVTSVQRGTIAPSGDIAWLNVSDVPVPKGQNGIADACVVVDGHTIYVLGGRKDATSPSLNATYIGRVDGTGTIAWKEGPPMPEARSGAGCAISPSSAP